MRTGPLGLRLLSAVLILSLSACASYLPRREGTALPGMATAEQAAKPSLLLPRETALNDGDLVIVTFSGGGMRAAVMAAHTIFWLRDQAKLEDKIDVISSVSGGSIVSSLYGLSRDNGDCVQGRYAWKDKPSKDCPDVFSLLTTDMESLWLQSFFRPDHILSYWFADMTRSDLMALKLDDRFFAGARLKDFNPQRPMIVINTSNFTDTGHSEHFTDGFTFTSADFKKLDSDVDQYPLAYAVMSSSAFPLVFHPVTVRNFKDAKAPYIHFADGGNTDNLGLLAVERMFKNMQKQPNRILIVEVDASLGTQGMEPERSDTRDLLDYFLDTKIVNIGIENLMLAGYHRLENDVDARGQTLALDKNKGKKVEEMEKDKYGYGRMHIELREVYKRCSDTQKEEWKRIRDIGTRYSITGEEIDLLRNMLKDKVIPMALHYFCYKRTNVPGYMGIDPNRVNFSKLCGLAKPVLPAGCVASP